MKEPDDDCMVLGGRPGTYRLLELEHVKDATIKRHNITLAKLGDLFPYPGYLSGIQPLSLASGDQLSPVVEASARKILTMINQTKS